MVTQFLSMLKTVTAVTSGLQCHVNVDDCHSCHIMSPVSCQCRRLSQLSHQVSSVMTTVDDCHSCHIRSPVSCQCRQLSQLSHQVSSVMTTVDDCHSCHIRSPVSCQCRQLSQLSHQVSSVMTTVLNSMGSTTTAHVHVHDGCEVHNHHNDVNMVMMFVNFTTIIMM